MKCYIIECEFWKSYDDGDVPEEGFCNYCRMCGGNMDDSKIEDGTCHSHWPEDGELGPDIRWHELGPDDREAECATMREISPEEVEQRRREPEVRKQEFAALLKAQKAAKPWIDPKAEELMKEYLKGRKKQEP